jgi:hypothetical protein
MMATRSVSEARYRRFIYAFGGAGLLTLLTAATGLLGVRLNSRMLLGVYGSLLAMMLLGQAAVAIACFADDAWSKHLPPDETGEAKKVGVSFLWPALVSGMGNAFAST